MSYQIPNRVVAALDGTAGVTKNGNDFDTAIGKGLIVVIDITAITGTTPTATFTIEGKDEISGKYYTILTSAALNSVSTTVLRVYPGLTAAANLTVNDITPNKCRVRMTSGGTNPAVTYTVAAYVLE